MLNRLQRYQIAVTHDRWCYAVDRTKLACDVGRGAGFELGTTTMHARQLIAPQLIGDALLVCGEFAGRFVAHPVRAEPTKLPDT